MRPADRTPGSALGACKLCWDPTVGWVNSQCRNRSRAREMASLISYEFHYHTHFFCQIKKKKWCWSLLIWGLAIWPKSSTGKETCWPWAGLSWVISHSVTEPQQVHLLPWMLKLLLHPTGALAGSCCHETYNRIKRDVKTYVTSPTFQRWINMNSSLFTFSSAQWIFSPLGGPPESCRF